MGAIPAPAAHHRPFYFTNTRIIRCTPLYFLPVATGICISDFDGDAFDHGNLPFIRGGTFRVSAAGSQPIVSFPSWAKARSSVERRSSHSVVGAIGFLEHRRWFLCDQGPVSGVSILIDYNITGSVPKHLLDRRK